MWKFRRRSVSILILPQATNLSWIQWPSCTQCKIQLCSTSYDLKKSTTTTTTTTQMDGLWRQLPPFKWCFVVFQPNPTCFNACWSTSRICKRSCRKEQKPVPFVHFFLYDCLGTEKRCQENCSSWQKIRTFSWGSSWKKKKLSKKMPRKNSFRTWGSGDAKACQCSCVGKKLQKKHHFWSQFQGLRCQCSQWC